MSKAPWAKAAKTEIAKVPEAEKPPARTHIVRWPLVVGYSWDFTFFGSMMVVIKLYVEDPHMLSNY